MRGVLSSSVLVLMLSASSVDAGEEPKLTFTQDGKDLVVSMSVEVNGTSHALLTSVGLRSSKVTLWYCLFQHRDYLVRHKKQVHIQWRLPGQTKEGKQFEVHDFHFLLSTDELKQLTPQLQMLAGMGEKRHK